MITQSFLYNAIYFTYGLVLVHFYGVSADMVPLYGLAFAVGNLCGPLILAPLFDSVGRKPMISGTYIISGVLLAISGWLFNKGDLTATTQTFCWIIIFFFASAGASAAYLTVSETWPIEIRAEAIAVFFAIAQIFGAFGPVFYGALIGTGTDRTGLFIGYLIGGAIMVIGGIVELLIGIKAEGKSLEDITKPITSTRQRRRAGRPDRPRRADSDGKQGRDDHGLRCGSRAGHRAGHLPCCEHGLDRSVGVRPLEHAVRGVFLPQVITAIAASLLGAGLSGRFGTKRVYLAGLAASLLSMTLLLVSAFFTSDQGSPTGSFSLRRRVWESASASQCPR